jgi:protein-S-isoprenylcysteine O-methyltransferase Ste14
MSLYYIIWALWFLSEILLNRLLRSGVSDTKNKDNGSIRLLWISVGFAIMAGIFGDMFFAVPLSKKALIPHIGLLIILLGMLFRFTAIWSLGRLFTVDVTIRENHYVKKDGMYRIIRHPAYTGMLICFIGYGISQNNLISLIVIVLLITAALLYRIKIEEAVLVERFNEEYSDYMKKTWRLIPCVY